MKSFISFNIQPSYNLYPQHPIFPAGGIIIIPPNPRIREDGASLQPKCLIIFNLNIRSLCFYNELNYCFVLCCFVYFCIRILGKILSHVPLLQNYILKWLFFHKTKSILFRMIQNWDCLPFLVNK